MQRSRALRTLNVNSDSKQVSLDSRTIDAAFSCAQNDLTGNKYHLERNLKNLHLLKENKLTKQLKQETQVMEQQASSSRLDPSFEFPEDSKFATIDRTEEAALDYFPPTGLLCLPAMLESSTTTTTAANECEALGALASTSNNIVADLHEKLYNSHAQSKKRANRKRSRSADTDNGLPLLKTIVNEILSLEADFPLPSTSFEEKRCRRRKKKPRKANENLALVSGSSSGLVEHAASCSTPVISDSDSDCEITAYVPSHSQQMHTSELTNRNLETNVCDLSVLELDRTIGSFVPEQNSGNANHTKVRLDSIMNMLHDTVQRMDDDVIVIEDEINLNRNVVEAGTTSGQGQLTPPVIVVSDDESEPAAKPAVNKQLKSTGTNSPSGKERRWECPICWEKLTSARGVYSTMCGHVYCSPCIRHVLKTTKKCPMCRKSLTNKKVHPLFLDEH